MLHHQFEHLGYSQKRVTLHMDNCSGQNRNNTDTGYGMCGVLCGLHEVLVFNLMEVCHTKFSPDRHISLCKIDVHKNRNRVCLQLHAQDVEEEIRILKRNVDISDLPDRLPISGMDATRQWYLIQEIAPFCHYSDFACSMPEIAKRA